MKKAKESLEKIAILEKLGFKHQRNGFYTHKLIGGGVTLFDFSANSIEGIVANIFQAGYQCGENCIRIKLLELLGVDE